MDDTTMDSTEVVQEGTFSTKLSEKLAKSGKKLSGATVHSG